MAEKLRLACFMLVLSVFSFAQEKKVAISQTADLPADIAEWSGRDSDEILENAVIKLRLQNMMGNADYESFSEYFETITRIEKRGDFLFAGGCMIHACMHLESAIAINLKNKTVHTAIFDETKETKFFNENESKTPEPILAWAKRLGNLRKP